MRKHVIFISLVAILLVSLIPTASNAVHPSYSDKLPVDTVPFYPGGSYDESIPKPNDYLAYPVGFWPSRYGELVEYLKVLDEKSDRVKLTTHGQTHEGRTLYNMFIGTPENIAKLDELKKHHDRLADPTQLPKAELKSFISDLPAVAWLGYSIHGDEVSGVDAGIQLLYQLAAGTDSTTMHLLENVVVIIDPIENPDGRERYLSMLETYRSKVPNYDRNSQQHQGVWPYGRGNHYLFDLNRDWILVTQPETEGRLRTILDWHPQMVVDAHEMGSNATYLFSPPRQPINYNTADNVLKWWNRFSLDQAKAFDQRGWPYYVKEWHEQWYPGYGSSWATFFGTISILYEQAGVDGSFVKQQDDYLLTYHESVNHQFRSSLSNLYTLANNRTEIMTDYYNSRNNILTTGQKNNLTFLVIPGADEIKNNRFLETLLKQGIEISQAEKSFTVSSAVNIYNDKVSNKNYPAGTYIISTAQVHGALVKAILEFDPHLKLEFLKKERRELEKHGGTKMYETSTWSIPLAYALDAYSTNAAIRVASQPVTAVVNSTGEVVNRDAIFGFVIDMVGEKTYLMLNRLFGEELTVYASEKAFTVEGNAFKAGALVLRKRGNPKDMVTVLDRLTSEIGINAIGINTGVATKGSYLGAGTFRLLKQPKVALVTGSGMSTTSFGSLWFAIDQELKIPHSLINATNLAYTNLNKYNVLIMPESWGGLNNALGAGGKNKIKKWISDGGTFIALGNAAVWAADSSNNLSSVRIKRQVLDKLAKYDKSLKRAQHAEAPPVDTMDMYHPTAKKVDKKDVEKPKELSAKEAKELDDWQQRFMPRGVFLKTDLESEDWMNFGLGKNLPASIYTSYAFMADESVSIAARFTPDETKLRLSGMLWSEARSRWAGTAYATHERKGSGQIILFASHPNHRAYHFGTRQMFVNAVLYGPGMGSSFEGPYLQEN